MFFCGGRIERWAGHWPEVATVDMVSVVGEDCGESATPGKNIRWRGLCGGRGRLIPNIGRAIASRCHDRALCRASKGALRSCSRFGQRLQGAARGPGAEHCWKRNNGEDAGKPKKQRQE